MKSSFVTVVSLALSLTGTSVAETVKPESLEDRASYGIGLNLGRRLAAQQVQVNVELVAQGLRDAMGSGATLLSEQEVMAALQELDGQVKARSAAMMAELGTRNQEEGAARLEANAAEEGVIVRPSGLQYKVLTEGTGKSPTISDQVTVHYRGELVDGTVFDSSYDRDEPTTFGVGGVIRGWIEALPLMKEGSKWRLWIPGDLAYGAAGRPPVIGPNATLIFDVELIKVGE